MSENINFSPAAGNGDKNRPTPTPGRFTCMECHKSFGRVEHLTRHTQSHSRERSHVCRRCRKGFYRLDALTRHERTHESPAKAPGDKLIRACLACSSGRRKCSRDTPCSACSQRAIECIYPNAPKDTPWSPRQTGIEEDRIGEAEHTGSITSPISWNNLPSSVRERHSSYSYTDNSPPVNGPSTFSPRIEPPPGPGLSSSDVAALVTNELNGLNGSTNHQSLWNTNPNLGSYQENWLDSNFSSINWLPDDWTPAFELSDGVRVNHQSHDAGTEIRRNQSQSQPSHPQFNGAPLLGNTAEPRRHWVETNTPRDSFGGSEQGSTPSSQPSTGRLYVDSDGARLPRVRKAAYQNDEETANEPELLDHNSTGQFWFPNLDDRSWSSEILIQQKARISKETYDEIYEAFQSTCIASTHFSAYYTSNFLHIELLSGFVHLYLLHFQHIFPFIHAASFRAHSAHWLQILAMGAVGSLYYDGNINERGHLTLAMLEFVRRALLRFEEKNQKSTHHLLLITQIRLLSSIGSMYCGNKNQLETAQSNHYGLVEFCKTGWNQSILTTRTETERSTDNGAVEREWEDWYHAESRRRTGYCIWLLDCMWAFHFLTRPLLCLEDATMPIPCQEVLWEAHSAGDWKQLQSVSTPSISLHSTVQRVYLSKQLQPSMGEFSRILCIHALFRRTWDVETYYQKPLTAWTPTADKQDVDVIDNSHPIWLPSNPSYSKWRNSACDVLDILHWHANSVIGAASGMEHPTVLHLHLARVVLLTPFREIVKLASLLTGETGSSSREDDINTLKKHVQRWALEDQYKARLAMIHAGVVFWHVRRFSTDAFYEPSSVFLATLALWAYGTFANKTPPPNPNPNSDSDDGDGHFPNFMQLDRPADDELVQLFVKRGSVMKANILGVGNLCTEKGPGKVLIEGKRLLSRLRKWGISRGLGRRLGGLIEVLEKARNGTS